MSKEELKEQNEFKLVRILNKYFGDILLETLSECANEIIQAGFIQIQAGEDGLIEIEKPCDKCKSKNKIECEYCDDYTEYSIRRAYIQRQKALGDKQLEEANKLLSMLNSRLALADKEKEEAVKKVGDKIRKFDKGEGWIELGEADLADIIKQTLEEK